MVLKHFQRVLCRFAAVYDDRFSELSCQFKLHFKYLFLYVPRGKVIVEIQPDLPHRLYLGVGKHLPQLFNILPGEILCLMRVDAG